MGQEELWKVKERRAIFGGKTPPTPQKDMAQNRPYLPRRRRQSFLRQKAAMVHASTVHILPTAVAAV